MKKRNMLRACVTAVAAIMLVVGSITAYAAVNDQSVTKIGDKYCVDTVISETNANGILVQTVERKWIPENLFNKDDPRNPISSTSQTTTTQVDTLRQAATNSRNDLANYAYSYQWTTTAVETSASATEVVSEVKFQVNESASADRWVCTFTQYAKFDASGNAYVEYYIGSQKYSTNAIKRMFAAYGKAR
jgi:hypothetical protein